MRRCRRRFVGLPGGCDFIVSDSILARNPGRSSGPHLWRAGSCGLRVVQNPRPFPISVFRGCFHSRSVSPVAFSPRRLSWLRINRPVTRPTASLDTERGVSAYSGGFPPLELTPFPGRNRTLPRAGDSRGRAGMVCNQPEPIETRDARYCGTAKTRNNARPAVELKPSTIEISAFHFQPVWSSRAYGTRFCKAN
jgi:hypothetical protein